MSLKNNKEVAPLVDHLFRNEAGKMVAVLSRIFGFQNITHAEDIVHDTLLTALETWKFGNIPPNPEAWLYRVAKNKAIDIVRRQKLKYKVENNFAISLQSEYTLAPLFHEMFAPSEIRDSQLRMMFACCHPIVAPEAQISLILNILCGLSAKEIASAFLTKEDTVNKRLYRTKEKIRAANIPLDYPGNNEIRHRTEAVLKTLYLLFNEGYNSSHPEKLIREDLCEEAMRLTILLTENPRTNLPETTTLLALMCFQASRFNTRLDENGFIILLKDQDRSQWNRFLIQKGNELLSAAAPNDRFHEFHIEAAIAALHSNATSFENTEWTTILSLYDALLRITPNPMAAISRCLVVAETEGSGTAISELEKLAGFSGNFYYKIALGELNYKAGKIENAKTIFKDAIACTTSGPVRELLQRKINRCS